MCRNWRRVDCRINHAAYRVGSRRDRLSHRPAGQGDGRCSIRHTFRQDAQPGRQAKSENFGNPGRRRPDHRILAGHQCLQSPKLGLKDR